MSDDYRPIRHECAVMFEKMDLRLRNLEDVDSGQNVDIAVLKNQVQHVVCAMDRLTKGLWGLVTTIIIMIIGLIIDKVLR